MSIKINEANTDLEEASQLLKSVGLRRTVARINLLQCLAIQTAPRTQAEIGERLSAHGFDDSTIFRGLTDLTEAGLVVRIDAGDHMWRFELHDRNEDGSKSAQHHPHAICTQCGSVICMTSSLLDDSRQLAPEWDIHSVTFSGICEQCRTERRTSDR